MLDRTLILAGLWSLLAPTSSHASDPVVVTVELIDAQSRPGRLQCAAWATEQGFPFDHAKAVAHADASVQGTRVSCALELPPGRYAVAVMHDENGNGRIDKNFVGMPTEGWATSNNVVHRFRGPTFDESAVQIDGPTTLRLELHY